MSLATQSGGLVDMASTAERIGEVDCQGVSLLVDRAREAQLEWLKTPIRSRLARVKAFRRLVVDNALALAEAALIGCRSTRVEKLAAEVIPLADACLFLEQNAARLLKPQRLGGKGRPVWLLGCSSTIERAPLGVVLIVAPGNYPLLLAASQAIQALAAGNAVLWKPAEGQSQVALGVARLLEESGFDRRLVAILPEAKESVQEAIIAGVDKVIFTGSATTGSMILQQLAAAIVPATMELSGCDACFVLDSADVDVVARSLAFGLRFNGSETCIAPRRVFVSDSLKSLLESRVLERVRELGGQELRAKSATEARRLIEDALACGSRLVCGSIEPDRRVVGPIVLADVSASSALARSDLFAPWLAIIPVAGEREMLEASRTSPFALSASVFGESAAARRFAGDVRSGSVVINDLIAPTADPRLPFGGLGKSGFGATRGAEGLLELTTPRVTVERKGNLRSHLEPTTQDDEPILEAFLRLSHGPFAGKAGALKKLASAARKRLKT